MNIYDTDTCIEILRANHKVVKAHNASQERVPISFMTVGELYYGTFRSQYQTKTSQRLMNLLDYAKSSILIFQQ